MDFDNVWYLSLTCPDHSEYNSCASPCPATCADVSAPFYCSENECVESCECKTGYVLDGETCVLREQCGCFNDGTYYMIGDRWTEDCSRECECSGKNDIQCVDISCHDAAFCGTVDGIQGCHCSPGYVGNGSFCEFYDPCNSNPCLNGGICTEEDNGGYSCECVGQWSGANCDEGSICRATGDPHYHTFDGRSFEFQGPCRYTLTKDISNGVNFNIEIQNRPLSISPAVAVVREMYVEVHGYSISIIGRNVQVDGINHTPPAILGDGEVKIFISGRFIVVEADFGLEASFDGQHYAMVFVPGSYAGLTRGLCGILNGNPMDDSLTSGNTLARDWNDFGLSWLVSQSSCPEKMVPHPSPSCDAIEDTVSGETACGLLTLSDGPFRSCHHVIDPVGYFDDCVFDMCHWQGVKGLCETLETYADVCKDAGVPPLLWRTQELCPLQCPQYSRYSPCTSGCPATCSDPEGPRGCDRPCAEGCACLPGYIRSGEECVPADECGCSRDGRYFKIGESWGVGCDVVCECVSTDNIQCREVQCDENAWCGVQHGRQGCHCNNGYSGDGVTCEATAICRASGDPHHRTYDNRVHWFQGPCMYTLTRDLGQDSKFNVEVQNEPLPWLTSLSVVREVYVEAYFYRIGILQRKIVTVNDEIYSLPFRLAGGRIQVRLSGRFVLVELDIGVKVYYNGYHYSKVVLPAEYQDQVGGLCGNYNNDPSDDFMMPSGITSSDLNFFGQSWIVDSSTCPGGEVGPIPDPPSCNPRVQAAAEAADRCGLITDVDGPFASCHAAVDPQSFYDDCLFDICARDGDVLGLCQTLEVYSDTCTDNGVAPFSWRASNRCPGECPPDSTFYACTSPCPATCSDPDAPNNCPEQCVEGCACNPGFVLSGQSCVPEEECGCTNKDDRYFLLGERWGADRYDCVCTPGNNITCEPLECNPEEGYDWMILDGVYGCICVDDRCAECEDDCSDHATCRLIDLQPTCVCDDGYEGDGLTCENIDDCDPNPCQNGGTCTDGVDSFTCDCIIGFEGYTCRIYVGKCDPNPCQNGGNCTEGQDSFECACGVGFLGIFCETNIDDCDPNPCLNGGNCTDEVNDYTCDCVAGYVGDQCETGSDPKAG
ncbi:zonadhesin-like [Branchiostoma floridae x Branchiostoma belcheri]